MASRRQEVPAAPHSSPTARRFPAAERERRCPTPDIAVTTIGRVSEGSGRRCDDPGSTSSNFRAATVRDERCGSITSAVSSVGPPSAPKNVGACAVWTPISQSVKFHFAADSSRRECPMSTPQSRAVAWDLVEHVRATLTVGELHAVFVQLGLGEDRAAIGIMLQSLMRAAGPRLPEQLRARLVLQQ